MKVHNQDRREEQESKYMSQAELEIFKTLQKL